MFKSLQLGDIISTNKEAGYYIKVNYMYGDADGYTTDEVGPFFKNEEKYVLAFVNMLQKCMDAYPDGRSGVDEYRDKVAEIDVWTENLEFDTECPIHYTLNGEELKEEDYAIIKRIGFELEHCPDGWGTEATIISYSVTYFDADTNILYEVNLK